MMASARAYEASKEPCRLAVVSDVLGNERAAAVLYRRAISALDGSRIDGGGSMPFYPEVCERRIDYAKRIKALDAIVAKSEAQVQVQTQQTQVQQVQVATGGNGNGDGPSFALTSSTGVCWADVAGLAEAKMTLRMCTQLPRLQPMMYANIKRWKGVLLYGPPGTGKSRLAMAVATECNSAFISVSSADLVSKWQGDSERAIQSLFAQARKSVPSVIFIDEVDSIAGMRAEGESESTRRIKTQLLSEMDGVLSSAEVLVLAATNTPWSLDTAFRRRFEKKIYIPLPDARARESILHAELPALAPCDVETVARLCEGFSGADVSVLARTAKFIPIRRVAAATSFAPDPVTGLFVPARECPHCPPSPPHPLPCTPCTACGSMRCSIYQLPPNTVAELTVHVQDLVEALLTTRTSVEPADISRFDEWTSKFGVDGA